MKSKINKIIVFGAGNFGSLISNLIHYQKNFIISAFGDDNLAKAKAKKDNIPILNLDQLIAFARASKINKAICSIGNNEIRAEKYKLLTNLGFEMISLKHPNSLIDTNVEYGKNVIIEMGTAIHTKSKIGNNVFLGGDALIGHHNIIKDHVLIGGNVSLGGSVVVEEYASIGVGASVKPGVTIGKGSIVGVGAAVIKDVSPHSVVVGVPAKEIKKNE